MREKYKTIHSVYASFMNLPELSTYYFDSFVEKESIRETVLSNKIRNSAAGLNKSRPKTRQSSRCLIYSNRKHATNLTRGFVP